jgi:prepilin-type N-terminal cleavage/methylation domain-containing protein
LKTVIYGRQRRGGQLGFNLIELMIAIAISVLLMVGTVAILRYMVVQTAENGDRTMAQLQVQYIGSWISEDVVQAQHIHFGNSTGTGFPLILTWIAQDGGNNTVTYDVVNDEELGGNPWQLTRTSVNSQGNATSLVAEYLDPAKTKCDIETVYDEPTSPEKYVVVLDVDAKVDQSEENSTFEISPRYSGITWD